MENTLEIIQYIVWGLLAIVTAISTIYGTIKGSKSKFLTKFLSLLQELETSVEFAEQMTKLNGEDKKTFAKKSILMFCENKNIKISEEQLDNAIESIIELTKKVNARDKDLIGSEINNELDNGVSTDLQCVEGDKAIINENDIIE